MFENEEQYKTALENLVRERDAWKQTVQELLQANINFKLAFAHVEKQQEISKKIIESKNKEIEELSAKINMINQVNPISDDA